MEYGENAVEALARETREELSEEVETERLILVADNLFELDDDRFQEIALYFLIGFLRGSKILGRDGVLRGNEPGIGLLLEPVGVGDTRRNSCQRLSNPRHSINGGRSRGRTVPARTLGTGHHQCRLVGQGLVAPGADGPLRAAVGGDRQDDGHVEVRVRLDRYLPQVAVDG